MISIYISISFFEGFEFECNCRVIFKSWSSFERNLSGWNLFCLKSGLLTLRTFWWPLVNLTPKRLYSLVMCSQSTLKFPEVCFWIVSRALSMLPFDKGNSWVSEIDSSKGMSIPLACRCLNPPCSPGYRVPRAKLDSEKTGKRRIAFPKDVTNRGDHTRRWCIYCIISQSLSCMQLMSISGVSGMCAWVSSILNLSD